MTPKGVINMGISREGEGMIGVFERKGLPIYGYQKRCRYKSG
jgi:hypothetical protein